MSKSITPRPNYLSTPGADRVAYLTRNETCSVPVAIMACQLKARPATT